MHIGDIAGLTVRAGWVLPDQRRVHAKFVVLGLFVADLFQQFVAGRADQRHDLFGVDLVILGEIVAVGTNDGRHNCIAVAGIAADKLNVKYVLEGSFASRAAANFQPVDNILATVIDRTTDGWKLIQLMLCNGCFDDHGTLNQGNMFGAVRIDHRFAALLHDRLFLRDHDLSQGFEDRP